MQIAEVALHIHWHWGLENTILWMFAQYCIQKGKQNVYKCCWVLLTLYLGHCIDNFYNKTDCVDTFLLWVFIPASVVMFDTSATKALWLPTADLHRIVFCDSLHKHATMDVRCVKKHQWISLCLIGSLKCLVGWIYSHSITIMCIYRLISREPLMTGWIC